MFRLKSEYVIMFTKYMSIGVVLGTYISFIAVIVLIIIFVVVHKY